MSGRNEQGGTEARCLHRYCMDMTELGAWTGEGPNLLEEVWVSHTATDAVQF